MLLGSGAEEYMLPTWLCRLTEFWNKWSIRVTAPLSLFLHILLLLLADTRRYNACPWLTLALWAAYQLLHIVGGYALGHLTLDDTGDDAAAESEQLLVAFWAPFLLLHLGGPDNVGAYSLDDDKLGWRKAFGGLSTVAGALYVVVTKIWLADAAGLLLRVASGIMFAVGFLRFSGNVWAMLQALRTGGSSSGEETTAATHEEAKDMLFDASHDEDEEKKGFWRAIVSKGWEELWKEATETASKLHDVLYTKAGQVHTVGGYLLRLVSPLATAAALVLFVLYPKDDCVQAADVVITYVLLSFALLLDVAWLVAALASTSAYEFVEARRCFPFRRQILRCGGWWHELRGMALLLHPWQLVGGDPSGYRTWLGSSVGRYDLLRECTRAPAGCTARLRNWLYRCIIGQGAAWDDFRAWRCSSQLPEGIKRVLFQRTMERLDHEARNNDHAYAMEDIRAHWGQVAVRRKKTLFPEIKLLDLFGREFQEDILLWHIATSIYLCSTEQQQRRIAGDAGTRTRERVRAIEVVSEYLVFLAAARPHMLPDPPLPRLYEVTEKALQHLYNKDKKKQKKKAACDDVDPCCSSRKKELADILCSEKKLRELADSRDRTTRLILAAARLAILLQNVDAPLHDVVELVFDVWVDKLLYAAIRGSRESHARQLGRGGELVTIVWIAAEYAGLFIIGTTPMVDPHTPPDPCNGIIIEPRKCPDGEAGCCCSPKEKETCHCHQGPWEPVGPHTCCVKDYYCCTQNYDYC